MIDLYPAVTSSLALSAVKGKILLIDPLSVQREQLAHFLQRVGHTVIKAADALAGLDHFIQNSPIDLVIMAAEMNGLDGVSLCLYLRQQSAVPIILLSDFCNVEYLAYSIQLGADDHISRSLPLPILQARLQAMLRRGHASHHSQQTLLFANAELVVNVYHGSVIVRDQPVVLTPCEYQLLCYLITHSYRVVTKGELVQMIWGYSDNTNLSLVRVNIFRLRKKIESNPECPTYIVTVRGGYQFRNPPDTKGELRPPEGSIVTAAVVVT